MCGIFAFVFNKNKKNHDVNKIISNAMLTQHRGPDNTTINITNHHVFVFHRLTINDQTNMGNQPMKINNCILVCNGEIYNHKTLAKKYDFELKSSSDCEIILHMYQKFGIDQTLQELDGVFAFCLYDPKIDEYIVARDPFGVRSLYLGKSISGDIAVCSELKSISNLVNSANLFTPGHYWTHKLGYVPYYNYSYPLPIEYISDNIHQTNIVNTLTKAVKKRMMAERPIGCFLSGGLDSSIVTALVAKQFKNPKNLHTFSIGLKNATDVKYAKIVADYLGTTHHEVIITEKDLLDAVPQVIRQIESYDTTSVRASTPMYLLSKWIQKNTDIAVIFSGEGSDELSGSYMYFHNAPSNMAFQNETIRLAKDLHYFDNLRCDKSTAAAGLEVRVPFLDKEFVQMYLQVPPEQRKPRNNIEKYILRKSFENFLPTEIVWRTKEAFSDGVSSVKKSWFSIIQEHIDSNFSDEEETHCKELFIQNPPHLKETTYYRMIFEKNYPLHANVIPYLWLPKWCGGEKDPSARVLSVYKNKENKE